MAKLYSNGEGENGQGWIRVGAEPSKNRRMNTKPLNNPQPLTTPCRDAVYRAVCAGAIVCKHCGTELVRYYLHIVFN
jgi:hypothetical protein